MATHGTVEAHHPDNMSKMDYAEHERTYAGFLALTKWAVAALVVLLALMGFFLT